MVMKQQSLFEEIEEVAQEQQVKAEVKDKSKFKQTEIGEIPESWEVVSFEKTINIKVRFKKESVLLRDYLKVGSFPIIDQGQSFIAGYTNRKEFVIEYPLPIIVFGDHTRIFKFVDFPFVTGADGTKLIAPNQELFHSKYLFFAYLNLRIPNKGYNRHFKILREQKIPLPPLDEQKRIAEVLTTIQNNKQALKKELELEQERKAALMEKLFREGLNNEPLKQTEIGEMPESWQVVKLGDVCHSFQYGSSKKSSREGQIPILRMGNIQNGEIDWTDLVYSSDDEEIAKYKLVSNTVLFNRTNSPDLVGKTAIYKGEKPALFAGYLIRINNISELLDPFFLNYIMNTSRTKKWRLSVKSDSCSQSNINAKKLASFLLQLPPIEEQKQIAEVLTACDGKIQALKKEINLVDELFQSMLNDLMSGKINTSSLKGGYQ